MLQLVSSKLSERFKTLKEAFRYLDTDHSQAISLNEFAQAIDFLRLKLSFSDVSRLFNFIDKNGTGSIGYDEFTLLTEEKWRGIDPFKQLAQNEANRAAHDHSQVSSTHSVFENCANDMEKLNALEQRSKNLIKVPLKRVVNMKNTNINRSDPTVN